MTDKNGVAVVPGCWVKAVPVGASSEDLKTIRVDEVDGTGQDMGVEVIPEPDGYEFEGGGGRFGGGGASGSW